MEILFCYFRPFLLYKYVVLHVTLLYCFFVVQNSILQRDEPLNSPKCIILAPGSHRVRHIARLCSAYVGAKLITIATHGGGLELERKVILMFKICIIRF